MEPMAPKAFLELVTNDPLFAAEGMDLEEGEKVLDAIEAVVSDIADLCSKTSFAARLFFIRYPVASHALPLPFVRAFIESERTRREFVAHPTLAAAGQLLAAWEQAQKQLAESVRRYTALHKIAFTLESKEIQASSVQDMHGNLTSARDVDTVLRLMRSNTERLGQEIIERRAILAGTQAYIPKKIHESMHDDVTFVSGTIPERYEHLHRLELAHSLPFREGSILETFGPLSYVLPAFDGKPVKHQWMAYLVRNNATGVVSLKLQAVDVYLFLKIAGQGVKKPQINGLYDTLIARGFRYWHQPSTNLYTCRDQSYWFAVATIVDLQRRPWLSMSQVARQHSSLFESILGTCLEEHRTFLLNLKDLLLINGRLPSWWYLLLSRTYPSVYYLPCNKSVWRIPEQPNFVGVVRAKSEDTKCQSADYVLADTTPGELEQIMQGGRIRAQDRLSKLTKAT